jgi:hypothetical protein
VDDNIKTNYGVPLLIGFYSFRIGISGGISNEISVLYVARNFMAERLPAFKKYSSSWNW